jgi:predicted signal transduction protein with EAL and GGDEF domain
LQQVADRLRATLRESDTAARLGGDEFAILLPTEQAAGAEIVSRKLLQAVDAPYQVEGHRLVVSASTGIALFPDHGNSTEELMRRADVAMYEAKRGRLGVAVYSVDRDINTKSRLALIAELREATEKNDLVLQFQPKLTLLDMSVGAVEALVRWQHPERVVVSARLYPLAEEIGFIHPIFRWVLDAALKACRSWENAGTILNVAVNLSATDLRDAQLVALVAETLQAHGLAPHRLTLELTETTVMDSRDDAQAILVLLHELGVRISVDDFGVGYSSLAYLARLSVHELKVDRSFIRHLNSPGPDRLIVQSVLDLGRHLDLALVAEGVEDRETLDLLRNLGCDYAQGYHIARPMFAGDLLNWLKP